MSQSESTAAPRRAGRAFALFTVAMVAVMVHRAARRRTAMMMAMMIMPCFRWMMMMMMGSYWSR